MAIKKAKNGKMLEFVTIKIKGGFTARELAALAILECSYQDDKLQKLLNKKYTYNQIVTLAKEQIEDSGYGCVWERYSDSEHTEEQLESVAKWLTFLSGTKNLFNEKEAA